MSRIEVIRSGGLGGVLLNAWGSEEVRLCPMSIGGGGAFFLTLAAVCTHTHGQVGMSMGGGGKYGGGVETQNMDD